jgi:hypothetical protein
LVAAAAAAASAVAVPAIRREEDDEYEEEEEEEERGEGRVDGGVASTLRLRIGQEVLGAGRLSTKLNEW